MLLQEYTTAGFLMRMFSSPSDGKRFAELDRGIVRAMVEFSGILEDSKPKATSPSTKTLLTDLSESLQQVGPNKKGNNFLIEYFLLQGTG